jgi:broad specificity phosphatase PhoE
MEGNGTATWKDARLTPKGHEHAMKANRFWKDMANTDKIPPPEIMYTSPLFRCLQTVNITFADYPFLKKSKGIFVSEVPLSLREAI